MSDTSDHDSILAGVIRKIGEDVRSLWEDHQTAAIEFDDFADETNARMESMTAAMQNIARSVEDLERSHAALCRRVDRLQGLK